MSTFSSPDDEITGSEDIIRKSDVLERIKRLESADCHGDLEGQDGCDNVGECPSCYGKAEEELAHLKDLLADFSGGSDSSFAVHEQYLEDYAQEEAESLDGISNESFFWQFINWEEAAQAITQDMQSTEFRGSTYWIAMR